MGGRLPLSMISKSLIAGRCLQWVINKHVFRWAVLTLGSEGTNSYFYRGQAGGINKLSEFRVKKKINRASAMMNVD